MVMDREQEEMQFLGVFGIYKEAHKIVLSFGKIFSQITLALILPLSLIFLAHLEVSNVLLAKITNNEVELDLATKAGTQRYNKLSDHISSEFAYLWLFKAAYLTLFLIFSLLSTAAVVYTVACIYTGREVSFNKVMSVVPKVWKRLMVTFLSIFIAFFAYHVVAFLSFSVAFVAWAVFIGDRPKVLYSFGTVLLVLYFVGLVYMTVVWQLASVVSVLEEVCGFKAMAKSRALIKGNMWMAIFIYFKLNLSTALVQMAFQKLVVHGVSVDMVSRISYGVICLSLLLGLFLFRLVIETVIYLVCKSYHHENIDKSALSDHLQVYQGEYVPLNSKDVQLEQFYV
ncbi:unnamed protein product [Dovyalis caffra]|uniref:Uncharacterized protein n=1 Tax=Dovyalis caffra TaxID=77055 RepID=A0AAV1S8S8_9ROSI|nr:unnamed protein product [Dovyalis caffra]